MQKEHAKCHAYVNNEKKKRKEEIRKMENRKVESYLQTVYGMAQYST